MKQAFAGAVLAAVVFTAAGFAYSTTRPNAVTPGQFNALKKRVAKLEKDDQAVSSYIGTCLFHWQGITQYGNPAAQQGFLYTPDGSTLYVRTGLDFPVQGQAPTLSIPATTNSNCTAVGLRFTSLHGTAPSFHGSIAKAARLSFTGK